MIRKIFTVLFLTGIVTCGSAATGLTILPNQNSDFYIGGHIAFTDTNWPSPYSSTGLGADILGGYQLDSMWSFEVNFTHFADATRSGGSISTNSFAGNAKLSLPIGKSKFTGFTKLGLANTFNSGDTSNSHFGLTMSYGVDLPILSNLTGEAIYTHNIGNSNKVLNTDFFGLGVIYYLPNSVFG
jgi:hypothetical protein